VIDEKLLAQVFRAAARGAVAAYSPPNGWTGMWSCSGSGYNEARSLAGAFDAIAEVFENLAKGNVGPNVWINGTKTGQRGAED
jgi:hypothetical protein